MTLAKTTPPDMSFVCATGFLARKTANEIRYRPRRVTQISPLLFASEPCRAQRESTKEKSRNDTATAFLIFALLVEEC